MILSGESLSFIIANFLAIITVFLFVMPSHGAAVAGCTVLLGAQTKKTFNKFKLNPLIHQGLLSIISLLLFDFAFATSSAMDMSPMRKRKKQVLICPFAAYLVHGIFMLLFGIAFSVLMRNTEVIPTINENSLSIGGSYSSLHNFWGMYFFCVIRINLVTILINLLPTVPFDGYYFLRAFSSSRFRNKLRKKGDIIILSIFVLFLTTIPQRFLLPIINKVCITIINIVSTLI